MDDYIKKLKAEYSTPLPENSTGKECLEWAQKDREKSKDLIDKYGEASWNIHSFLIEVLKENISESHFRELVRLEIDKTFRDGI